MRYFTKDELAELRDRAAHSESSDEGPTNRHWKMAYYDLNRALDRLHAMMARAEG